MRSAIIILSGWRFLSAFLRKKSPLGVFSRADPELSSYPFWLKLKMLSHLMWGYLSEYFRHLLSFSDSFLKTAYVAMWTLLAGCVIWVMGTFSLFSKTATWSGDETSTRSWPRPKRAKLPVRRSTISLSTQLPPRPQTNAYR